MNLFAVTFDRIASLFPQETFTMFTTGSEYLSSTSNAASKKSLFVLSVNSHRSDKTLRFCLAYMIGKHFRTFLWIKQVNNTLGIILDNNRLIFRFAGIKLLEMHA